MKRRPHIAFLTFPHTPDVNPTLPVVAVMCRRGMQVTYVTSERFAASPSALGANVIVCPPFRNPFREEKGSDGARGHPHVSLAIETLAKLMPYFEVNRPDVIIYDFACLAGIILAEKSGIPAIQTSPSFAFSREYLRTQKDEFGFYGDVLNISRAGTDFLRDHGVDREFIFSKEALNIFFYPKEFQLPGYISDETHFYASRCAPERWESSVWRNTFQNSKPLILVSTSTYYVQGPEYFRMCAEALGGLGHNVVLAIGDNNDASSIGPLPPEFEIIQAVPLIQVMPHAELLVCLGGMATSVEAMYHGVPLVMMTHGHCEAEVYAENAARLGLGFHLRKADTTVRALRRTVLDALDDAALRGQVAGMQRIVQRGAGAEEVANQVTDYLRSA